MLTLLLILLLLLSNSITSRHDKSILYSRWTITILLISGLISKNNTYLLFLNKGICGGLFHTTGTTVMFHIFIFLIGSSIILILCPFYHQKVWVRPLYIITFIITEFIFIPL